MISRAHLQMGHGPIPLLFFDHLHLGSNTQTRLTAKLCDRRPAGREKAQVLSFPNDQIMLETYHNVPFSTHCPHSCNFALNADTLSANLKTVVLHPCIDKLRSFSKLNMSLFAQVYQSIHHH